MLLPTSYFLLFYIKTTIPTTNNNPATAKATSLRYITLPGFSIQNEEMARKPSSTP